MMIGDPSGAWVLFAVITGVGVLVGAVVSLLLVTNRFRREEWRGRTLSRRAGAAVGVGVALVFAAIAHRQCWDRFYEIHRDGDGVRLVYYVPQRTVVVPRERIADARSVPASPKSRLHALVVRGDDGRTWVSGPDGKELVDDLASRLR